MKRFFSAVMMLFVVGAVLADDTGRKQPLAEKKSPATRQDPAQGPEAPAASPKSPDRIPGHLYLRGGHFDPLQAVPVSPGQFRPTVEDHQGLALWVVQLHPRKVSAKSPLQGWHHQGRAAARQVGAKPLATLPGQGMLLSLTALQGAELKKDPRVRWAGPLQPHLKLSSEVTGNSPDKEVILEAQLAKQASPAKIRQAFLAVFPQAREVKYLPGEPGARFRFAVPGALQRDAAAHLASEPLVMAVQRWRLPVPMNDESIWVIQSYDTTNTTTYSLSATLWNQGLLGGGQIMAVADSGLDVDMCFFKYNGTGDTLANAPTPPDPGPLTPGNKVIGYAVLPGADEYDVGSVSYHGTHVAGSVAGDNHANLSTGMTHGHDSGDGMAPQAQIFMQDVGDSSGALAGLGGDLYDVSQQAYNAGAFGQNDSWGSQNASGPLDYTGDAQSMDRFTWDNEEFLHLVAAGNTSGGPYVGSPAVAKNIMTVGATTNGSSNATSMASFSSVGPAADGRIKPDASAPGSSIISASGNATLGDDNCGTKGLSGTSMATPTMAGASALVREYFTDGFFPTGAANAADAMIPSAALLKAVLVNSTDDLGTADIPNGSEGWGRIRLDRPLFFAGDTQDLKLIDKRNAAGLATGEEDTFTVDLQAGGELRVTLVWTDAAAALSAGIDLVNDLNLVVEGTGGPWLGNDFASGLSTTGGSADSLNNVEQVRLSSAGAGTYTIRVQGFDVPGNGFTPMSDRQGYALLITGNFCNTALSGPPAGLSASDNGTTGIDLSWSPVAGATGYEIYRQDGTCGAPTSTLTYVGQTAGTTFTDTLVQGGYAYSYRVRAVNNCTISDLSSCSGDAYTGNCTLQPDFDGLQGVTNNTGTGVCDLDLTWNAGTSSCPLGNSVSYAIYRSTDPYFTPGPGNLLASGVVGTSYSDSAVSPHQTSYYVVRAEDGTSLNGGPANGGNQETGDVLKFGTPTGAGTTPGTFTDDGGDTAVFLTLDPPWQVTNTQNHTSGGTYSYHNAVDGGPHPADTCAAATTPEITLQAGSPELRYWANYNIEWEWDGIITEISTDGGNNWIDLPPNGGYPGDLSTGGGVGSPINACGYSLSQGAINGPVGNAALTGWTEFVHDLTAYAGQAVMIRWNFTSDPGFEVEGFYLDDISVSLASTPAFCTVSAGFVTFDRGTYGCSDTVTLTLVDNDLAGNGSHTVELFSTTETTPEVVTLTETTPGTFVGTYDTTSAPANGSDGKLSLSHNDTLTARYTDADDGQGGFNVVTTDTADADCQGPVISNVVVTVLSGTSIRVTWDTDEAADSRVDYALLPPAYSTVSDTPLVTSHSITLTGLQNCKTYYIRVASADAGNNLAMDDNSGALYSGATPKQTASSLNSSDTPLAIPDSGGGPAASAIAVADTGTVSFIEVTVDVTHTYDQDLVLSLIPPTGPTVVLSNRNGGSADNYTNTVFSDNASLSITGGVPPFTGDFRPEEPLSNIYGNAANGSWQFEVEDFAGADTGTINSWTLDFITDGTCPAATSPPPVPNGAFGTAMGVSKGGGSNLSLTWDTGTCTATGYKVIYGDLANVGAFTLDGSDCGIGTSGSHSWTNPPGGDLFFLIVSDDGAGTEGSWGVNGAGSQRNGSTASSQCSDSTRDNAGTCPAP